MPRQISDDLFAKLVVYFNTPVNRPADPQAAKEFDSINMQMQDKIRAMARHNAYTQRYKLK